MLKGLLFVALLIGAYTLHAQNPAEAAANEGIWEGYDGEWRYVSRLLISILVSRCAAPKVDHSVRWKNLFGVHRRSVPLNGHLRSDGAKQIARIHE